MIFMALLVGGKWKNGKRKILTERSDNKKIMLVITCTKVIESEKKYRLSTGKREGF